MVVGVFKEISIIMRKDRFHVDVASWKFFRVGHFVCFVVKIFALHFYDKLFDDIP